MPLKAIRKSAILGIVAGVLTVVAAAYGVMARTGMFQVDRDYLIARYADSESKYVEIRGIGVHYKDEGEGPPLLLLHGSFGSLRTWDVVVDDLKAEFRLIRWDQPPSALSGDIPDSQLELPVEDFVSRFLDEVGVDRAVLAGTSSGGIIAYRFAAKYPERAVALVIANSPSSVLDSSGIATPRAVKAMTAVSTRLLHHRPKVYWRWFLEWLYGDPSRLSGDVVEQYFDMGRKNSFLPRGSSMYVRVADNDEIDEILRSVRAPTLVLWGLLDPVLPESMALQLQEKLASAPTELVRLEGTGHYPPVESPELVAQQIRRFLTPLLEASQ